MNDDLISREALLLQIGEKLNVLRGCNDFKEAWGIRYAMVMIQNAPAVDAVEVGTVTVAFGQEEKDLKNAPAVEETQI